MITTLINKIFKIGEVSDELRGLIEQEGIEFSGENIKSSITYINFSRPGKSCQWNRRSAVLSLYVTVEKLVCISGKRFVIDVPYNDQRFSQMSFELERDKVLVIGFESSLFHDDWSGQIECRFKTNLAKDFLEKIHYKLLV